MKTSSRILGLLWSGLKAAILGGFVIGLVLLALAPSFFGIVFITSSAIATWLVYTLLSFVVGLVGKVFADRKAMKPVNLTE